MELPTDDGRQSRIGNVMSRDEGYRFVPYDLPTEFFRATTAAMGAGSQTDGEIDLAQHFKPNNEPVTISGVYGHGWIYEAKIEE
jgi:hypothetical protein